MNRQTCAMLLMLLLIIMISVSGCNQDKPAEAEINKEADQKEEVLPVEIGGLTRESIVATYFNSAYLEAENETDVISRSRGIVKKVYSDEGAYVKKGELLAKLDDSEVLLQLQLENNRLSKAEADFKRKEELLKKDLVPKELFEQVIYDLNEQKISRDMRKLSLAYTEIRAPISGVITVKQIIPGNMVSEYQSVFRITSLKEMHAELYIPEIHTLKIKKGQKAQVTFDALGSDIYEGVLSKISPVIDPSTGTFKVTVKIENKKKNLKPGMFARIRITYDIHENALTIPTDALIEESGIRYVFIADGNTAKRKQVKTGFQDKGRTEVSGLDAEAIIIVTGFKSLKDGSKINIIN